MQDLRTPFQDSGQSLFVVAMQPGALQEATAIAKAHLVGGAVCRVAQALQLETV